MELQAPLTAALAANVLAQ